MKIYVVGAGYVGLTTAVCLAEVGHHVTCIEVDEKKVEKLKKGISPIYEPGLTDLLLKHVSNDSLVFTTSHQEGYDQAEAIFIAVGTPENADGSADLTYVESVVTKIARTTKQDTIVVTKSTVPVGTNDRLQKIINCNKNSHVNINVVSNPEFLREGSAIHDSFYGDRIVIGTNNEHSAKVMEEIYKHFEIPIYKTDIRSAEMIKYASNAFLATKISFINEIANLCERVGADVEKVAHGMGMDQRIGHHFLNAGIGYGGSCFPKDIKALIQIAGNVAYDFELLKSVVKVNKIQKRILLKKLYERVRDVKGKKIAILGLAFKPNTDDMREAPSIPIIHELLELGAIIYAYDPVANENAKKVIPSLVQYTEQIDEAILEADAAIILTEWSEIINLDLNLFTTMKTPLIFDGRNCFDLEIINQYPIEYYPFGRPLKKNLISKV